MFPMPQELRIRGKRARAWPGVLHGVFQTDGIATPRKDEGLGHGEALAVVPGQRHEQLFRFRRELVRRLLGGPRGKVRRRGFARCTDETGLQHVQGRVAVAVQQAHRHVRVVLVQRIFADVGAFEFAALQVDEDVEHIGDDVQRCTYGGRTGRDTANRGSRQGSPECCRTRRTRGGGRGRHRGGRPSLWVCGLRDRIAQGPRGRIGGARAENRCRSRVVVIPRLVIQIEERGKRHPQHDPDIRH